MLANGMRMSELRAAPCATTSLGIRGCPIDFSTSTVKMTAAILRSR
jgi:hypothetical protein